MQSDSLLSAHWVEGFRFAFVGFFVVDVFIGFVKWSKEDSLNDFVEYF